MTLNFCFLMHDLIARLSAVMANDVENKATEGLEHIFEALTMRLSNNEYWYDTQNKEYQKDKHYYQHF